MLRDLPEIEFGPQIEFREYSIFENQYMPAQVLALRNIMSVVFSLFFHSGR